MPRKLFDDLSETTLAKGVQTPSPWMPTRPVVPVSAIEAADQIQALINPPPTTTVVVTPPAPDSGVPLSLIALSATESPTKQQGRTFSEVSVSFTPAVDPLFDHVNIWFEGYQGVATPQLMTSGVLSPITFLVETTHETVTVFGQTVTAQGTVESLFSCMVTTVSLDGVVSAPPAPTIAQTVVATAVGYQFAFYQLVLSGGTEDVISTYNIYRNTTNNSGTATVIRTFIHDPHSIGNPIIVQDPVGNTSTYWYWVSAVNTAGLESTLASAMPGGLNKEPTVIIARKSVYDTLNNYANNVAAVLGSEGYAVTNSALSVPNSVTCAAYDIVVIDCCNFSANEHNAFIETLLADGQRVLVQGNDSASGLFYFTGGVSAAPVGVAAKTAKKHILHDNWTTLPGDGDSGYHPTGLVAYAIPFLQFSDTHPAGIEIQSSTGGMLIHIQPQFSELDATDDGKQFIRNVAEYMGGRSLKTVMSTLVNLDNFADGAQYLRGTRSTMRGGVPVVNSVKDVTAVITSPATGDNTYTQPNWITGEVWSSGGAIEIAVACTGSNACYVFVVDSRSGNPMGSIYKTADITASIGTDVGTGYLTANANDLTGWIEVEIYVGAAGVYAFYLNGIFAGELQDKDYVPSGSIYYAQDTSDGKIGPGLTKHVGSTHLVNQASLVSVSDNTMTFSATTTSITWAWTAFDIYNPDGSVIAVGSGSQAFSSLTAATTYYFGVYYDLGTNALTISKSDLSSGTVKESARQVVQVINGDGHVPMWVNLQAATPAAGTTPPATPPGGGGRCFTGECQILTKHGLQKFSELPERVEIHNQTGEHWATVIKHENHAGWMIEIEPGKLVTPDHMMRSWDDWIPASQLYDNESVWFEGTVYNLHIESANPDDQHYILWDGNTAHNMKASDPTP